MIELPEPFAADCDGRVGGILDCCAASYSRSPDKRAGLQACRATVVDAAAVYRSGMPNDIGAVMATGRRADCGVVADAYKDKLSNKNAAACRVYYDRIFNEGWRAAKGMCPFCEIALPSELDHYLPKSEFPVFALTPANLVPICSECNKLARKGDYVPGTYDDALFHPYFDMLPEIAWLHAEIHFEVDPCVSYGVDDFDGGMRRRLERTMDLLGLNERYGLHAVKQLWGTRDDLRGSLAAGGINGLKVEIEGRRLSWEECELNGWMAALWRAAERQVDELADWLMLD